MSRTLEGDPRLNTVETPTTPTPEDGGADSAFVGATAYRVLVKASSRDVTATASESPAAAVDEGRSVRLLDKWVPRRLQVLVLLALVMCVATVLVDETQHLPIRD